MQIERHEPFRARLLDQVCDQLGGDRLAAFGLLILLGVAVVRDDGGDAVGRSAAERIDHQEQFHQRVVDGISVGRTADRLQNEDLGAAHVLFDFDAAFLVLELVDERAAKTGVHARRDLSREVDVGVAAEEQGFLDYRHVPTSRETAVSRRLVDGVVFRSYGLFTRRTPQSRCFPAEW